MTMNSNEVHEPSDADIDDMRIHMTLHDLRGLAEMNLSVQDVNVIISALEPIHMALTSKITVSGDVQNRESRPKTPSGEVLYPRQCVKCGSGMQEGYLSEDGDTWCSDACLFSDGYTKEEYQKDNERGTCFWTEWEWDNGWSEQWTESGRCFIWIEESGIWEESQND